MAEADAEAKIDFLLASQPLLDAVCRDPRDDLALSGAPEFRSLPTERRIALLEQRHLRAKAARKCPAAARMIFTPLGLEQLTHWDLAAYKAARMPAGLRSLADLCCGLGGDSLAMPPGLRLVGVDLSRATLKAYRHNLAASAPAGMRGVALGDVAQLPVRAEAALLDPSRRLAGKSERWQDEGLSPGWEVMERLIVRFGSMAVKLGPGSTPPAFLEEHEWEYLGLRDECLELAVWTGSLGKPGLVKATELPGAGSVEAWRADIPDSFGHVAEAGAYLFEPVKAVVRAHLFGVLAERHGLWQIDPRIAYLSGNQPVVSPLLKAYKLIRALPYDWKALREFLRKEQVGRLEVKKRGIQLIPEAFREGLKLAGENQGTLIFTRIGEKKTVFWAQALKE